VDASFGREPPVRQLKRKLDKCPPIGAAEEVIKRYLYPRTVMERYGRRKYDPPYIIIKDNIAKTLGLPINLVGPALNRLTKAGFLKKIQYPRYDENDKPNTLKLLGDTIEWHPTLGWVCKIKDGDWGYELWGVSTRVLRYRTGLGHSALMKRAARIKRKQRHKEKRTNNFKLNKVWSNVDGKFHTEKKRQHSGIKFHKVNWDGIAYEVLDKNEIYQSYGKKHGLFDREEPKEELDREELMKKEFCPRCGGQIVYKRKRGKARRFHKKRHCNLNVCDSIMNS